MENYKEKLYPDGIYHIYNRSIRYEKMFADEDDYKIFLNKLNLLNEQYLDLFSFCLMPNHFHLLTRIKSDSEIIPYFLKTPAGSKFSLESFSILPEIEKMNYLALFLSKQFSHLFNSYTQRFNKKYKKYGVLFQKTFNRKKVKSSDQLRRTIIYIHLNPFRAKLASNLTGWPYNSYSDFLHSKYSPIKREEVIGWFDDLKNFVFCHEEVMKKDL